MFSYLHTRKVIIERESFPKRLISILTYKLTVKKFKRYFLKNKKSPTYDEIVNFMMLLFFYKKLNTVDINLDKYRLLCKLNIRDHQISRRYNSITFTRLVNTNPIEIIKLTFITSGQIEISWTDNVTKIRNNSSLSTDIYNRDEYIQFIQNLKEYMLEILDYVVIRGELNDKAI